MSESRHNLDSDAQRDELFITCITRHKAGLRRYVRSLLPEWGDAEDVLQLTAVVIWRKFDRFAPETQESDFMKWACVIARFEALAYRRKKARERLVFHENPLKLLEEEAADDGRTDALRAERDALGGCLRQLPERQRQFVLLAYTPGVKITELAEQSGSTAGACYMRLKRLRRRLRQAVEDTIESENALDSADAAAVGKRAKQPMLR